MEVISYELYFKYAREPGGTDSICQPVMGQYSYDIYCSRVLVSGYSKGIRTATFGAYFLWYAACKYLPGYYERGWTSPFLLLT